MEKNLNKCLDDISQVAGVKGCLLTDEQGLCLGAKGRISPHSSGIVAALAQQAQHVEPDNPKRPVIILESDNSAASMDASSLMKTSIDTSGTGSNKKVKRRSTYLAMNVLIHQGNNMVSTKEMNLLILSEQVRQCFIQGNGKIVSAIQKNLS